MFKLFGRCEMIDAEIMDVVINYWKDDPIINKMFASGNRVLLSPFTIPVCFLFFPKHCY
jgi:hypothetical protein